MRKTIAILTILMLVLFMVGCENSVNPTISDTQNMSLAKADGETMSLAKKGGGNKGGNVIDVPDDSYSIQTAIDAAVDGDVIKVGPGIYIEELVIDGKDISLIADGDVTIAPPPPYVYSSTAIKITNGKG